MAITTLDQLIAAPSQRVGIIKTAAMTTAAAVPFTPFDRAGNPGAGVLAGSNTAAGVVPAGGGVGFPAINAFAGGATGYLLKVDFGSTVACRLHLFDLIWKGGAYAFNAAQAVASPSWAARVPGGTDFTNTELWFEQVTAATGIQSVAVTYKNQNGVAGRTTGAVSQGTAGIVGRMTPMPLQAGDTGVQAISNIAGTVATAGTFNVLVMRRLWSGRVSVANGGDTHDMLKTGLPQVFDSSALYLVVQADGTSSGVAEVLCEIANG